MSSASPARVYTPAAAPCAPQSQETKADLKLVETTLPKTTTFGKLHHKALNKSKTLVFTSTFYAREDCRALVRHELHRLVAATRRQPGYLFCDLLRIARTEDVFIIYTASTARASWLPSAGWNAHPAGPGLLDQCLCQPTDVVEMEEEEIA